MTVSEERIKDLMYGRLERLPSYLSATDRVDLQSICTELLAARRENEWQKIETAPRDGTRILGCSREHEYCVVGYFRGLHFTDGAFPMIHITHWQNLPPPPETAV